MAIATLLPVNRPAQAQPERVEKRDPIDEIMRGLSLANSAFGIGASYQTIMKNREERELFPMRKQEQAAQTAAAEMDLSDKQTTSQGRYTPESLRAAGLAIIDDPSVVQAGLGREVDIDIVNPKTNAREMKRVRVVDDGLDKAIMAVPTRGFKTFTDEDGKEVKVEYNPRADYMAILASKPAEEQKKIAFEANKRANELDKQDLENRKLRAEANMADMKEKQETAAFKAWEKLDPAVQTLSEPAKAKVVSAANSYRNLQRFKEEILKGGPLKQAVGDTIASAQQRLIIDGFVRSGQIGGGGTGGTGANVSPEHLIPILGEHTYAAMVVQPGDSFEAAQVKTAMLAEYLEQSVDAWLPRKEFRAYVERGNQELEKIDATKIDLTVPQPENLSTNLQRTFLGETMDQKVENAQKTGAPLPEKLRKSQELWNKIHHSPEAKQKRDAAKSAEFFGREDVSRRNQSEAVRAENAKKVVSKKSVLKSITEPAASDEAPPSKPKIELESLLDQLKKKKKK